jgi:undecaprenyl-diphosphatase
MDLIPLLKAAFIGLVCGVTEFLPISSNGHVIILDEVLGFRGPPGKLFEISLQLGAILAVCWLYRHKLLGTLKGIMHKPKDRLFALNIFVAFVPAALIGFLFHHFIIEHLFKAWVVALMLVVGGIAILAVEKWKSAPRIHTPEGISFKDALLIGLFQSLAMIPGVSRSGATIMGALLLGIERRAAAEFSFFLAIPMIFVACAYDFYVHRHEVALSSLPPIAVGFIVSLCAALVVVQWLMNFLSRHGFVPFAWYRIIAGTAVLAWLYL